MSTVLAYGNIGEDAVFSSGRAEIIEKEDKRIMVDALIFNRDELESERGDDTMSDASLLYTMVEREGWDVLKRVNGDFAGAVYEKSTGIWTLFRDHLGVRPLYFYTDDRLLVAATDMRDIAYVSGVHLKIDERQLWLKLAGYNNQSLRNTEFENIKCVCPGSYTVFTPSQNGYEMKETRYFRPGMKKIRMNSDEEYIAEMRRLVEDSIRRRVAVIDGTAGAELSGGLDSSVIDILIKRMGKPLKCVSWRIVPDDWPLQPEDERIVIHDVCEQEGLECEFISNFNPLTVRKKEIIEPPSTNTRFLGEIAKVMKEKEINYVFSGQGGDEGVSHRANVLELLHSGEYLYYFSELWATAHKMRFSLLRFIYYILRNGFYEYPRKIRPWKTDFNSYQLLSEKFKKKMNGIKGAPLYFCIDSIRGFENGGIRLRPETAAFQTEKYGVQFLYPFEDYRVFDFAVSIPRHLYFKNGISRWIYRQAFDDVMPQSLRNVNYKDFPSLRNGKPEQLVKPESEFCIEKMLHNELDRNMWSQYIDFNVFDRVMSTYVQADDRQRIKYATNIENIYSLIMIQRMIKLDAKN